MPSHVPRSLEPYSQRESLSKREQKLRRVIAAMAPISKLHLAAEGVRSAQLLLLKAESELIRYASDSNARQIENIERKREHWQSVSVEAILIQYANE